MAIPDEVERPSWFRRSVLRAYSENLLSKDDAERMLETDVEEEDVSTLQRRREFMKLPVEERQKIMRRQAEELEPQYEDAAAEGEALEGGDVVKYE